MKRYKVVSGDMEEIVEAESHEEAAAKLFTMFDDWPEDERLPVPGAWISTIEVVGEELWHRTNDAVIRSGRLYRCVHCGKTVRRDSEKRWIKSYCDGTGRTVRLQRVE